MKPDRIESIAGGLFIAAFIGTHLALGITAAVRVLGVACVATGLAWALRRSVPVGIEGRPPSFILRGLGALLSGLAMVAIGVALLVFAQPAACLLGWAEGKSCT